jgi:hypothetical protein
MWVKGASEDRTRLQRHLLALGLDPATELEEATTIGARSVGTTHDRRREETPASPTIDAGELASLPRIDISAAAGVDGASDFVAVSTIAEGGMGRILLARQTSLAREVAVKMPREDASRAEIDALVHEARVAATLEHPSVVPIHALGVGPNAKP